ncbi:MAG: GyrI-like domain-containing protein [Sphingobacteriales bacterium]|nr:GyrI-like domain-containing protein [Sphingobacteriales bacterium]
MEKTDLLKQYKPYYSATAKPVLSRNGPVSYISVCGKGDPSGPVFAENIGALYRTAYTIKAYCKKQQKDFTVPKLEGLWWYDEKKYGSHTMAAAPGHIPREEWEYRLLIRMPGFVRAEMLVQARETIISLKEMKSAPEIDWFVMDEGEVIRVLHTGPFATEPATLGKIQDFMKERGLVRNGLHHEIYLSDFRRTAADRLKTILCEPVK